CSRYTPGTTVFDYW
nr:immunoglobulin heavy chain junction region [Macaca mulatta]